MFKFTAINGNDLDKINEIRERQPQQTLASLDGDGGGGQHLVMPHEAFTVGLSSLQQEGNPMPEASGLRVIDADGANFKSIFDLAETGGTAKEPQKLLDETFLNNYKRAFARMFGSGMEARNFEVRSLKIPALHVDAIWLHKDNDDLYIPIQSMGLFDDDQVYQKKDFFDKLKTAAKAYDFSNEEMGG